MSKLKKTYILNGHGELLKCWSMSGILIHNYKGESSFKKDENEKKIWKDFKNSHKYYTGYRLLKLKGNTYAISNPNNPLKKRIDRNEIKKELRDRKYNETLKSLLNVEGEIE